MNKAAPHEKLSELVKLIKRNIITKAQAKHLLEYGEEFRFPCECGLHFKTWVRPELTCEEWIIKNLLE